MAFFNGRELSSSDIFATDAWHSPGPYQHCLVSLPRCFTVLLIKCLHLAAHQDIKPYLLVMGKKRVLVGYGVDIDAIAGWLGSYKGEDSTSGSSLLGNYLS